MKKTLVSALTTALVVGAASTTFAASNPFSDVPAGHWAYDAVSQLAADGVIEGYGDGTYRGDNQITRYEMAQMVAKAMAKSNVSAADKAMIDKLAAEFSDELNNLGVRVSNLERNADMVKWNGKAEYTMARHVNKDAADTDSDHTDNFLFRLEPSAEVNSNWHVNARVDANINAAKDEGDDGNVSLKRIWAQGDYDNFSVKLGKFATLDNDSVFDTTMSGAEVSFGNNVKGVLGYGRQNLNDSESFHGDKAANHFYVGANYAEGKFMGGVSYHTLKSNATPTRRATFKEGVAKADYRFDKNSDINGFYAKSSKISGKTKNAQAYSFEYDYKGAEQENAGTWGAWLAYRHLGQDASQFNTFDVVKAGEKGWEIGGNYTFFKNIVGTLRYSNVKDIDNSSRKAHTYFGRVEFFF